MLQMTEEEKTDKKNDTPMRQQVVDLTLTDFDCGRDSGERGYLVNKDGPNVALYGKRAKTALAGVMYYKTGTVPGR
jgi:hypothetical protein